MRHTPEPIPSAANASAHSVIGAAIAVHRELGPGLLESAYERALAVELEFRGHDVRSQVTVPMIYRGRPIEPAMRLDLLVDQLIVVEVKAIEALLRIHEAQLLTYLRFSGHRLGFLLNFHHRRLRDGIRRIAL